jgi:hypothetical protein
VGGREGAGILGVDAVQLRGRASLVRLSRRGQREEVRPEGSDSLWTGEVLPVQALLRPALRELARGQERPGLEAGAEDQGRFGGSANMLEPFPESPKGMHHDRYMRLSR